MKLPRMLGELGRRLFRRVPTGFPVELEHHGERHPVLLSNLSLGGGFIQTDVELPLGSAVRLRMSRPHVLEELDLLCEVRWHERGGAGLRFVEPTTRDLWVLSVIVQP